MNKNYQEELKEKFTCLITKEEVEHMNEIVIGNRQIQDPPFVYYPVSDRWDILVDIIVGSQYVSEQYRKIRVERELEYWNIPKSIYSAVINECML